MACTNIIAELSGHTVAYADKGQSKGRALKYLVAAAHTAG
jgi:hypothetical protein